MKIQKNVDAGIDIFCPQGKKLILSIFSSPVLRRRMDFPAAGENESCFAIRLEILFYNLDAGWFREYGFTMLRFNLLVFGLFRSFCDDCGYAFNGWLF